MPELGLLGKVIVLQVLVAAVTVYVLKRLLDKELIAAALERAEVFSPSAEARKTEKIVVITSAKLSAEWRTRFVAVWKEQFPRAEIDFLENSVLRGGVVIEIAGEVWDYSLLTRLKQLCSIYGKKDSGNNPGL